MNEEIDELVTEALTMQQMVKKSKKMKSGKVAAAIKRGKKKTDRNPRLALKNVDRLASKHAGDQIKAKMSGGKSKKDMSLADRVRIGKRMENPAFKRKRAILAKKLKKQVRKDVLSRVRGKTKKEEYLDTLAGQIIYEVFARGLESYPENHHLTEEQYAFNRVNSFIEGGAAAQLDEDLIADMTILAEEGGAGEFGTDKLAAAYANDTPGQAPTIEPIFQGYSVNTPDIVDSYANMVDEEIIQSGPLKVIKQMIARKLKKGSFENAFDTYKTVVKDSSGRKTHSHLAAKVAMSHQIQPRNFIKYIQKQINDGKAPQSIMSEYDPSLEEENNE